MIHIVKTIISKFIFSKTTRCCQKKAKEKFRLPPIDDIIASQDVTVHRKQNLSNGYPNKVRLIPQYSSRQV